MRPLLIFPGVEGPLDSTVKVDKDVIEDRRPDLRGDVLFCVILCTLNNGTPSVSIFLIMYAINRHKYLSHSKQS